MLQQSTDKFLDASPNLSSALLNRALQTSSSIRLDQFLPTSPKPQGCQSRTSGEGHHHRHHRSPLHLLRTEILSSQQVSIFISTNIPNPLFVKCKHVSYNMKCLEEPKDQKIPFVVARLVHAKNSTGLPSYSFPGVILCLQL